MQTRPRALDYLAVSVAYLVAALAGLLPLYFLALRGLSDALAGGFRPEVEWLVAGSIGLAAGATATLVNDRVSHRLPLRTVCFAGALVLAAALIVMRPATGPDAALLPWAASNGPQFLMLPACLALGTWVPLWGRRFATMAAGRA